MPKIDVEEGESIQRSHLIGVEDIPEDLAFGDQLIREEKGYEKVLW